MAKQHKIYAVWRKTDGKWRIAGLFQYKTPAGAYLAELRKTYADTRYEFEITTDWLYDPPVFMSSPKPTAD